MKIDYLRLGLAGSPGSVTSFVPLGQFVENDTRGEELGLSPRLFDWEGRARPFTDGIAWHKHRDTM